MILRRRSFPWKNFLLSIPLAIAYALFLGIVCLMVVCADQRTALKVKEDV
jgi:hypothetical protein